MSIKTKVRISLAGHVPLPEAVQQKLGVKPGDDLIFDVADTGHVTITGPSHGQTPRSSGRSIFDGLEELQLPSLGRPLTQNEIDEAIADEAVARFERSKKHT